MKKYLFSLLLTVFASLAVSALTYHRSFANGYPSGAQGAVGAPARTTGVKLNGVKLEESFAKFRNRAWVAGMGTVKRLLPDDLDPPCHQRFILTDPSGHTLLIVNNIDDFDRLEGLGVGDVVAFKGEYISNAEGGLVHWTHPDRSHRKPGGWLKILKRSTFGELEAAKPAEPAKDVELPPETVRKEYFAGRGPMSSRVAAPVNDDWPETGYWLSTNSGARHNKDCENYRKTRGYPCKKDEGRPCGKCGG